MNARQITELLAARHHKDVWLPECKDGPTTGGSHRRLDGWAMRKSWSNPSMIGYEIKVTRADFLSDRKWPGYLPLCNEFYFVAPSGVIQPEEIPDLAGLIVPSKNATRLYTKKRAPYREIEPPADLLFYALMRADGFTAMGHYLDRGDSRAYWQDWLSQREEDRELGYRVSAGIRKAMDRKIASVQQENYELRHQNKAFAAVQEMVVKAGFDLESFDLSNRVRRAIDCEAAPGLIRNLRNLSGSVERMLEEIEPKQAQPT